MYKSLILKIIKTKKHSFHENAPANICSPISFQILIKRNVHDILKPINYTINNDKTKQIYSSVKTGTGGRSSTSGLISTVFGCTGFIGKYVVNQLAKRGDRVIVPYRGVEDNMKHLKVMGDLGQIIPMEFDGRNIDQIKECVRHSDIVINLIGQHTNTRNFSLQKANVDIAENIAIACSQTDRSTKLYHISALNASHKNTESEYHRTKGLSEIKVKEIMKENAIIIRLGTVFGDEDYFLNRIGVNKNFLLLVNNGKQILRPVYVLDVARGIEYLTRNELEGNNNKIVELYGPKEYEYRQVIDMASQVLRSRIRTYNIHPKLLTLILKMFKVYPYRILRPEEMYVNEDVTQAENNDVINFCNLYNDKDRIAQISTLESRMVRLIGSYRSVNLYQMNLSNEILLKPPKKRDFI